MAKIKTFNINSRDKLDDLMQKLSEKNKGVYTITTCFESVYVKHHKYQSNISSTDIDDAPIFYKGYWQNGKFYEFKTKFIERKNKQNINFKRKKRAVFGGG